MKKPANRLNQSTEKSLLSAKLKNSKSEAIRAGACRQAISETTNTHHVSRAGSPRGSHYSNQLERQAGQQILVQGGSYSEEEWISSHNALQLKLRYQNFSWRHHSATRLSWHQHHGVPSCRGMVFSFIGRNFWIKRHVCRWKVNVQLQKLCVIYLVHTSISSKTY